MASPVPGLQVLVSGLASCCKGNGYGQERRAPPQPKAENFAPSGFYFGYGQTFKSDKALQWRNIPAKGAALRNGIVYFLALLERLQYADKIITPFQGSIGHVLSYSHGCTLS